MAARASDLPSPQPNGLTLTRGSGGRDLDDALETAAGGFGAPASSMAPLYTPAVLAAEGFSLYLGRVDGMPVSTSVGLTVGDTLGIFNVATPPEHRGRGYGAVLTVEAARAGFANGADLAWLQSSAMGHSVYERLGFRDVETHALLTR